MRSGTATVYTCSRNLHSHCFITLFHLEVEFLCENGGLGVILAISKFSKIRVKAGDAIAKYVQHESLEYHRGSGEEQWE